MDLLVVFLIVGVACLVVGAVGIMIHDEQAHKHLGSETGRRYVPGMMETGGKGRGFVDDEMIYGYTEITYKCECGHYWNERVVGKINER